MRGKIGANASISPNIVVKNGVFADIFLTDVNIDKTWTNKAGIEIESGATAQLWLAGNNSLKGGNGRACLEVPEGAFLRLTSADGEGKTTGRLTANNNSKGAGIGGGGLPSAQGKAGTIWITGGTIEAHGGSGCAGIGGADTTSYDGGGTINIFGGDVTAWGGDGAAGIGSGWYPEPLGTERTSNNTTILIGNDARVRAYGGGYPDVAGAGIGGAAYSSAGTIHIDRSLLSSGKVVAVSGGTGADRIGHGTYGSQTKDNNVVLNGTVGASLGYPVPERPTITAEVERQEERDVYTEITREVTREVTREILKKVDRIVGERVVDEIPIIKGLDGNFVFKPKTLSEIPVFYDPSGKFLVSQPQTITITQGNGQTASITLYKTDTMQDVADKIDRAIAYQLGQGSYTDNPAKFCTIADGTNGTSEAAYVREPIYCEEGYLSEYCPGLPAGTLIGYKVSSTMLVRSSIPGHDGELSFSGDDDILRALGLNTIQESTETVFTASVYDAHSGKPITTNAKASGPAFRNIISPEVDVEIDAMSGISANWDEGTKRYVLKGGDTFTANLHLKDNATIFQTGANTGEDFSVQLGDMSCNALGISGVNVASREAASRSMGILDRAISRVSSQRGELGAYQNALEHTTENLTVMSANLTVSESRIRDADMAKTMMDFVMLQVLNQSGTSMLAQANQLPQSVMSLLGN